MKQLTREERIAANLAEIKKLKARMKHGSRLTAHQYEMLCDEIRALVNEIERLKQ